MDGTLTVLRGDADEVHRFLGECRSSYPVPVMTLNARFLEPEELNEHLDTLLAAEAAVFVTNADRETTNHLQVAHGGQVRWV